MSIQLSRSRINIMSPVCGPDFGAHKIKSNMNCLMQHFFQSQYAAIADAILLPEKVQSHQLEHKRSK